MVLDGSLSYRRPALSKDHIHISKGQKLKLFQRLILTKILLPLTLVCSIIDRPFQDQYCPTVQQFRKSSKCLTEFVEGLSFGLTEIQKGC